MMSFKCLAAYLLKSNYTFKLKIVIKTDNYWAHTHISKFQKYTKLYIKVINKSLAKKI